MKAESDSGALNRKMFEITVCGNEELTVSDPFLKIEDMTASTQAQVSVSTYTSLFTIIHDLLITNLLCSINSYELF